MQQEIPCGNVVLFRLSLIFALVGSLKWNSSVNFIGFCSGIFHPYAGALLLSIFVLSLIALSG